MTAATLTRDQLKPALRLLAGTPYGRAAVTWQAMPHILPARHLVTGDGLLLRFPAGRIDPARLDGTVLAYEANSHGSPGKDAAEPGSPGYWSAQLVGEVSLAVVTEQERSALAAPGDGGSGEGTLYLRLIPRLAVVQRDGPSEEPSAAETGRNPSAVPASHPRPPAAAPVARPRR
ncbi:hypothetical protein GCM10009716_19360 [Streptomyces sodiiphilus]|uniref:Pyridoxamine 5'-phosphate oxidase family protein n=1 Tax=Streptomyces sodiiphilus TaxID=226217 RepID=A0ABN2P261_9ACTN